MKIDFDEKEQRRNDRQRDAEAQATLDAEYERENGEAPNILPDNKPFPIAAMGPLASFVQEVAQTQIVDTSFAALPVLAVVASAIKGKRNARVKRGFTVPAVLWTSVIAKSGTNKSGAFKTAVEPLRHAEDDADAEYCKSLERYSGEMEYYKRDLSAFKQGKSKTLPEEPPKPPRLRYVVNDFTPESLAPILKDNAAVLACKEELADWFEQFNRYNSSGPLKNATGAAKWMEMHDGRGYSVDRSDTTKSIRVPMACVSVTGTIQPGIFRMAVQAAHKENGLAPRLLMAYPPEMKQHFSDHEMPREVEHSYADMIDRLLAMPWDYDGEGRRVPRPLTLTSEAMALYVDHFNRLEDAKQHAEDDAVRAATAKLKGQTVRLALVLEMAGWAAVEQYNEPREISSDSMKAAICLANWFEVECQRVYGLYTETEEEADVRSLIEWMTGRGRVTPRDVTRGPRRYRGDVETAERHCWAAFRAGRVQRENGAGATYFWVPQGGDGDT